MGFLVTEKICPLKWAVVCGWFIHSICHYNVPNRHITVTCLMYCHSKVNMHTQMQSSGAVRHIYTDISNNMLFCNEVFSFFSICFLGKWEVFFFLIIQYAFTWLHWAYYEWYFQWNTVSILKQMKALHLKCYHYISFMCHWGKFKEYFICNQNVTTLQWGSDNKFSQYVHDIHILPAW